MTSSRILACGKATVFERIPLCFSSGRPLRGLKTTTDSLRPFCLKARDSRPIRKELARANFGVRGLRATRLRKRCWHVKASVSDVTGAKNAFEFNHHTYQLGVARAMLSAPCWGLMATSFHNDAHPKYCDARAAPVPGTDCDTWSRHRRHHGALHLSQLCSSCIQDIIWGNKQL